MMYAWVRTSIFKAILVSFARCAHSNPNLDEPEPKKKFI